jgi:hypothetical protein
MKKEQVIISLVVIGAVVVLYYYLKGSGSAPVQVTYPNNQASGVPASQNAATTYNIQTPRRSPDPSLIYGNPPPLPPTPSYQSYNYSPVNLLGLTPQGASAITKLATPGKPGSPAVGPGQTDKHCECGGGGCNTCGCSSGSGTYNDGGGQTCLAANAAEQANSMPGAQLGNLAKNIASSAAVASDPANQGLLPTGVVMATAGQSPAQPTINNAPPPTTQPAAAPPSPSGFLPWVVAGKLLGLNGNAAAETWYEQAAGFAGNG